MLEPLRRMEVFAGAPPRGVGEAGPSPEKVAIIAESYGAGEKVCAVARLQKRGPPPKRCLCLKRVARQIELPAPFGSPFALGLRCRSIAHALVTQVLP